MFCASRTTVRYVTQAGRAARAGDIATLERIRPNNDRIYRWAAKFLPAKAADSPKPPEPAPLSSPVAGLSAAAITEKAMALLSKSLDEDGESSDFLRGVLALYKALTAPGAEM